MELQARLAAAQEAFDKKEAERKEHLTLAEECMVELTKLQGEYRVLTELIDKANTNTEPTKIEAVAEKTK